MSNNKGWSVRMADSVMRRQPTITSRWNYEWGLGLMAVLGVWRKTGENKYFDYVKSNLDYYIQSDGSIHSYKMDEHNIDLINPGKLLFPLYRITGDERYKKAAFLLREQMRTHPRTAEGGFWHKKVYTQQMWLDGIYMACPFLAQFAVEFDDPSAMDEVIHQITLIDSHTRDPRTNLSYHGWDSVKAQQWADPETGRSPNFWGRALGWYTMALVDVLDFLPQPDPILPLLQKTAAAVVSVQDAKSGVWYQVLDQGDRPGNYLESSASCMFTYALAKGIRKGYLAADQYGPVIRKAYAGIIEQFVTVDDQDLVNLNQMCYVAGLGGDPYRDGSFENYISEQVVSNDFKGVGPFILASLEMEGSDS